MIRPIPEYLRLHIEENAACLPIATLPAENAVGRLCRSFRQATGWSLVQEDGPAPLQSPEVLWARDLTGQCEAEKHLAIRRSPGKTAEDLQSDLLPLCELLDSIADLWDQLEQTRRSLLEREAELAAGIPVDARPDDEVHLAYRLRSVLRGGAEAIGAQAAALYILDDATSQLKLRAAWGLPADRFLDAARPLRGAIADLEALTGHAVAIEDVRLLPHWRVPESFASALCVPVSNASAPLGTLWLFCDHTRDFDDVQTQTAEIVAGRIAADLERQMLLAAASRRPDASHSDGVASFLESCRPAAAPSVRGWDVAAATVTAASPTGDTYDWYVRQDDSLALLLVAPAADGIPAMLTSQLVSGAAKSAAVAGASAEKIVRQAAEVAWTSTAGEVQSSLAALVLDTDQQQFEFCSAGPLGALIVRPTRPTAISQGAAPLASDPDAMYRSASHQVQAGDVIVLVSDAVRKAVSADGEQLGEAAIAECLRQRLDYPAEAMAEAVIELWREHLGDADSSAALARDAAVLIARRVT